MYQQHIQGQNNNMFYPNYGTPMVLNPNHGLVNNQVQYQRQLNQQQQQNLQRNQQILQNAQHHKMPNTQILNPQQIHQTHQAHNIQNVQNLQKMQQNQNQKYQHLQHNQNYLQKQAILAQDNRKTYNQPQLQKNQINNQMPVNQLPVQNIPQQGNKAQKLRTQPKNQKLLAGSHLNLSQTPALDPVQLPPPTHVPMPIPEQKKLDQYQNIHQNQQQNYLKPAAQKQMENLKNTAIPGNITQYQNNDNQTKVQPNLQTTENQTKKSATLMTVNSLANIPYHEYPRVEFSSQPFFNICGYGSNSYNGKIKNYNEDMNKNIVNYPKKFVVNNFTPNISYFGVFDGHGGDKCSKFLKENFDKILFSCPNFPVNVIESIRYAFKTAENQFYHKAVQNGKLVDNSGSCALIALIINDILYAINLGDSRALYSRDGGKEYFQISRDHKPNDEKEKARIEKAGGKVYYANKTVVNGKEVTWKEEQFGKGFTFPYRLDPSGLAVSFFI